MLKRIISAIIALPIVVAIIVFGNKYVIDITVAIIGLIAMHEYFNAFDDLKDKKAIRIMGYLSVIFITFIHIIPEKYLLDSIIAIIPFSIIVLFTQSILTNMKYTFKDIAIVFLGICYITLCLMFIPIIRQMPNGNISIWFVFISAWGTDIFAYFIGKMIGRHKFNSVSPNKSIEGCVAGVIGSIICMLIFAYICNNVWHCTCINYFAISYMAIVLSIVGQLGDLAASSIKRYTDIKDFGKLIPGHGGILDRIDSILFIAPITYFLLMLI